MAMKTLLIQPDCPGQTTLIEALERHGHQVTVASDVEAGCTAMAADPFSMVFLDADVPGADGSECCRRLRKEAHGWQPILVAVTSGTGPGEVRSLLAAGADECLPHTMTPEQLDVRLVVAEHHAALASCPLGQGLRQECCHTAQDVPYGVFRSSVEGRFLEVNPALVEMLGYDSAEELCMADLATGVYVNQADRPRLIDEGGDWARGVEIAWKRKDGSPLTVRVSGRRLRGRDGRTVEVAGIIEDVTALRRAEDDLRESERRYRLIADNVIDVIWTGAIEGLEDPAGGWTDRQAPRLTEEIARRWRFTYMSPSIERLCGFTPDEAVALGLEGVLSPESFRTVVQLLATELMVETRGAASPDRQRTVEIQHRTKAGALRWCEVAGTFLRDADGRLIGVLGVTRDITQRREAERALRQSETMLRGLFENMPNFVIVVDRSATIRFVNRGIPGVTPQQLIGRHGFGFVVPEHRDACQQALARAIQTKRPQSVECVDIFDYLWSCRVVPIVQDGEVRNAMVICEDVTEQKEAEAAVRKEQELLRQLLELHERDRKLLAFELHDGFAQQLAGAKLNFEAAAQLFPTDPRQAQEDYQTGLQLLRTAIEESRRLVSGLRPPVLDEFGILPAIEHLVGLDRDDDGPEVQFVSKGHFPRLAQPLENAVFRIVQETLGNARRHSQSEKIHVELACGDSHVYVTVQDWGVGFDPRGVAESHFGLRGIRERARLLGGSATIQTALGRGTCIRVKLPLVERAPSRADQPGDADDPEAQETEPDSEPDES
jgi:PAS domain S-box-containing protein